MTINFVSSPGGRADEIGREVDTLQRKVNRLHYENVEMTRLNRLTVAKLKEQADPTISRAFASLTHVTNFLATFGDEIDDKERETVSGGLQNCRESFQALAKLAESCFTGFSIMNRDVVTAEATLDGCRDRIKEYGKGFHAERVTVERTCCSYERDLDSANRELRATQKRFDDYWNLSVVERLFNTDPEDAYGGIRRTQLNTQFSCEEKSKNMRALQTSIQNLCPVLPECFDNVRAITCEAIKSEYALVTDKMKCFGLLSESLDYSNQIFSSALDGRNTEAALKQILRLLYFYVRLIENDGHVVLAKENVMRAVCENFGEQTAFKWREEAKAVVSAAKIAELDI